MKYTIEVIKGSLAGKSCDLTPGNAVTLGRSHTNDIQFTEEDVSRRHVSITLDPQGVEVKMEVLSARSTSMDGRRLSMGDKVELVNGSVVQLGKSVQLRLAGQGGIMEGNHGVSADSDTKVPSVQPSMTSMASTTNAPSQGAETSSVPPNAMQSTSAAIGQARQETNATSAASSGYSRQEPYTATAAQQRSMANNVETGMATGISQDANATRGAKTRVASAEELEILKNLHRREQRRRLASLVIGASVFLGLCMALYITQRPKHEEFVTWPVDAKGNPLNERLLHDSYPYFGSVIPNVDMKTVKKEDGNAEFYTRIGRRHDVQMHVVISSSEDKKGLTVDRSQAFSDWTREMRQKQPDMNFNGSGRTVFINVSQGSGVPITVESYTRRFDEDDYYGYVAYFRNGANVHYVMSEVPLAEQWRCDAFLKTYINSSFLIYAIQRSALWWEGSSHYRKTSSIEDDLKEADNYLRHESPTHWTKIHYLTKSALIKAEQEGNKDARKAALKQLVHLRRLQAQWYNTKKLAYQLAMKEHDKETMDSIQSQGELLFSASFQADDYRYEYIRRKEWK